MADEQQQQIDRYIIRRVLGTGAMGSVYAAWDPKLHREVALKVVPSALAHDEKGRARFVREARAIAAARHPNIVEIYDYSGIDSKHLYLVIEKLDGEDLFATLHRRGIMPEAVAAAVGHELCLALQVAHEAGIVHRDLKPENVFLNATGRVVLTDFGIVKAITKSSAIEGFKEPTDVIGTPGFMAPELLGGRALGPAIDIFALGVLLYNITTKRLPYEGATPLDIFQAAAEGNYEDPRTHNPLLSEEFCACIASCLQPNPKKRPRSVEMVRQVLKTVLEENGISDVRDDLHDYMHNSESYRQMAHTRCVEHVLAQLKVASKDHDEALVERFRKRLLVLDPYNEEVLEVSGVGRVTPKRIKSARLRFLRTLVSGKVARMMGSSVHKLQRVQQGMRSGVPRWLQVASVGVMAACMCVTTYVHHRDTRQMPLTIAIGPPQQQPASAPIAAVPTLARPPAVAETAHEASNSVQASNSAQASAAHHVSVGSVDLRTLGGRATVVVDGNVIGRFSHKVLQLSPGQHVFEVLRRGHGCKRIITVGTGDKLNVRADVRRRQILVN